MPPGVVTHALLPCRYVDTEKDPYSAIKGFWYAHIGWMIVKQDKEKIGKADISGAYYKLTNHTNKQSIKQRSVHVCCCGM